MHEVIGREFCNDPQCTWHCMPSNLVQAGYLASLPVDSLLPRLYILLRLLVLVPPASPPSCGTSVLSLLRLRSAACEHLRLCHAA